MGALDTLIVELRQARTAENKAKAVRVAIEEQIVAFVENPPESGSTTLKGEAGRVSVKFGVRHKADVDRIRALDDVDAELLPLKFVPATYAFDAKAYERLRAERPDVFRRVAKHVTITKSKPGVTLKG